jgi:hypothetical protein
LLTLGGTISARGQNDPGFEAGAGSGGSIFIRAASFVGTGTVNASGGIGSGSWSGGGGGGRIAIYSCNLGLPMANVIANGGTGWQGGAAGTRAFGSSSLVITQQPQSVTVRATDPVQFSVTATGDGTLTYQWRFEGVALSDGGVFSGVHTDTLSISSVECADAGRYDCLLTDSCGTFPTVAARLTVTAPSDFNGDGGIDGGDVEAFFAAWENGEPEGDFNLDGGIDGADVEFFFDRWERGC